MRQFQFTKRQYLEIIEIMVQHVEQRCLIAGGGRGEGERCTLSPVLDTDL